MGLSQICWKELCPYSHFENISGFICSMLLEILNALSYVQFLMRKAIFEDASHEPCY